MKQLIWIGVFVGSTIGSSLPLLWGGSLLSLTSMLLGGVGAFVGIWAAVKINQLYF